MINPNISLDPTQAMTNEFLLKCFVKPLDMNLITMSIPSIQQCAKSSSVSLSKTVS